jgi:hypothetical protein
LAISPVVSAANPELSRTDIADELLYDFCPAFLVDEESLSKENPRLSALGFIGEIESREHPTFGSISATTIGTDAEGMMLAGSPEHICMVTFTGADRLTIRNQLKEDMSQLGLQFEEGNDVTSPSELIDIQTYKASLDEGVTLGISFLTVADSAPNPSVFATIYFKAE